MLPSVTVNMPSSIRSPRKREREVCEERRQEQEGVGAQQVSVGDSADPKSLRQSLGRNLLALAGGKQRPVSLAQQTAAIGKIQGA